jgi:phospholipid/cholesterol/gamma-HCH transport system substrate-binding protein
MTAPANHWKLGLFVVVGTLLGFGAIIYFGARSLEKQTVRYTSYFDEAVTGLDHGSAVSYRGVTIGNVEAINVAADHRHVEVKYDLTVEELSRLGLVNRAGHDIKMSVPRDVRVQLSSTGITGVKYLKLDFFDPNSNPAPELPFRVPRNYIPAAPSTLKNIEALVMQTIDALPHIVKQVSAALAQMQRVLQSVEQEQLPAKAALMLGEARATLGTAHAKLSQLEAREISRAVRGTLASLDESLGKVQGMMERVNGDRGLVTSLQRASDSVGDFAVSARGVGAGLDGTLRDLRATADAVRALVDALERDPDMLLKGRAEAEPEP